MNPVYCINCKREITPDAEFCRGCGKAQKPGGREDIPSGPVLLRVQPPSEERPVAPSGSTSYKVLRVVFALWAAWGIVAGVRIFLNVRQGGGVGFWAGSLIGILIAGGFHLALGAIIALLMAITRPKNR